MSLTAALSIAQNALLTTSRRTSVVSQNITNAENPDYSRRTAVLVSEAPGVRVSEIRRSANEALSRQNLAAVSAWEAQDRLLSGLNTLALGVNGANNALSPATALGNLQDALQLYAATPSSANLAEGAVDAARQLARSLNDGTGAIQGFRADMDIEIANAATDINTLLSDFEVANKAVVSATASRRDASDALDQRDAIVRQLAQYLPVSTFTRGNADMVLTTTNGVTLFETVARSVTFQPMGAYAPGVTGSPVHVDGVALNIASTPTSALSGRLSGLVKLRDDVAVTFQTQLDEIARGAIEAFAETDRSGGGAPPLAGLFTWSGGPSMPSSTGVTPGLAATITVNAAYLSTAGGNPVLLRDGGANGAAYAASGGGASFADLLISYGDRLDATVSFAPSSGLATSSSLAQFSANAIGWIEGLRQQASSAEISTSAMATRTAEALSNETGVNLDQEMSLLLDLEHAYEASARILRTVDEMMATLLDMA